MPVRPTPGAHPMVPADLGRRWAEAAVLAPAAPLPAVDYFGDLPPAMMRYLGSEFATVLRAQATQRLNSCPEDRVWMQPLLKQADSLLKTHVLRAAYAAGHDQAEMESFAQAMLPMSNAQVLDAATLEDRDQDGRVEAALQQLSYSCGPTVVQTLHGLVDPYYAWSLRQHGDVSQPPQSLLHITPNRAAQNEQAHLLRSPRSDGGAGGIPVQRGVPGGWGRFCDDLMDQVLAPLGVGYQAFTTFGGKVPSSPNRVLTPAQSLPLANGMLERGWPVPLVTYHSLDTTDDLLMHYMLALGSERQDGKTFWWIYEPWKEGCVRTQVNLETGTFEPPICGMLGISVVHVPNKSDVRALRKQLLNMGASK